MDAILVVNADSSSLKFQIFEMTDDGLKRRIRGQMDGIGTRPRLLAKEADGAVLVDRQYTPDVVNHLTAAIAETRAWLLTLEGFNLRAIGRRVVHGGRTTQNRS
jgi:acetate kinase